MKLYKICTKKNKPLGRIGGEEGSKKPYKIKVIHSKKGFNLFFYIACQIQDSLSGCDNINIKLGTPA